MDEVINKKIVSDNLRYALFLLLDYLTLLKLELIGCPEHCCGINTLHCVISQKSADFT